MLSIVDGVQLPVIPLGDVLFNDGGVEPLQIESTVGKSGITLPVTVTANVIGDAHCPGFGVKM